MENKKKKLKGMSLVEIIISLAVMAIMGILLITLGTTIDSTTRATNKLKSKIVQQSPYAAARATSAYVYDDDGKVILDSDGKAVMTNLAPEDLTISVSINKSGQYLDESDNIVSYSHPSAVMNVRSYNTRSIVSIGKNPSKAVENLDLKFIDPTVEEPTTTAPTP